MSSLQRMRTGPATTAILTIVSDVTTACSIARLRVYIIVLAAAYVSVVQPRCGIGYRIANIESLHENILELDSRSSSC